MRVISTQATTPKGNKYTVSRVGRITLASAAGAYGIYSARKTMHSDEFLKKLTKSTQDAVKNHSKYYKSIRKASFATFSALICAMAGFVAGGAVDFVVNRISKNKADNKQKA